MNSLTLLYNIFYFSYWLFLLVFKMIGKFQQSNLRIEVEASAIALRKSLLYPERMSKWLWPISFSSGLPSKFSVGTTYSSFFGPIEIKHRVEVASDNCLRLLLSEGIDGYHEWYWGDGWVQSRLEGISLLSLSLGQTFSLLRLRQFLTTIDDTES